MLEKQIESKVVKKAKELGFLTYKFSSPSNRGVPDRIFISGRGNVIFMEFKSEKGKLTKLQLKTKNDIEKNNVEVFVINKVEDAVLILTYLDARRNV